MALLSVRRLAPSIRRHVLRADWSVADPRHVLRLIALLLPRIAEVNDLIVLLGLDGGLEGGKDL